MKFTPQIQLVTKLEEIHAIQAAATKDNHYTMAPTHFWRNSVGEIIGYLSNGIIPVCHFWLRRDSNPRVAFNVIPECEKIVTRRIQAEHLPAYGMIICPPFSPFYKTLESHFGFKPVSENTAIFGKKVSL